MRIINAAMREFAEKGYKNASTDAIVDGAGISKGALFHYFGSKKNLYLYLYDYGAAVLFRELLGKIDMSEKDMFLRLSQIAKAKLELFQTHPDLIDFFLTASMEEDSSVRGELRGREKAMSDMGFDKLLGEFDTSKFRDGVDAAKVLDIVSWTINGLAERAIAQARAGPGRELDCRALFAEAESYLELLKQVFYK